MIELIRNDNMQIVSAITTLGHGFFIFNAPPFETEFGYKKNAESGELTDTCWGICRNGVPLKLPTEDDSFGIAIVDKDTRSILQGYYTEYKIPAYEYVSWYTLSDVIMPERNLNLICYVGYYDPSSQVLYHTDYREFTIKAGAKFPYWILLFGVPLLIPLFKK